MTVLTRVSGSSRWLLGGVVAAALLLAALPLSARSASFFAELENGVGIPSSASYGGLGYTLRANIGAGVGAPVLPIGIYGVIGFGWTHLSTDHTTTYHRSETSQNALLFSLSARIVVPLGERLRLFVDAGGGYRYAASSADIDGLEHYEISEGNFIPLIGGGIHYKLFQGFTLGVRSEWMLMEPMRGPDLPLEAAGLSTPRGRRWQVNVMLGATLWF